MGSAIAVRADFSSQKLRRLATRVRHAALARRLLAIAAVLDGAARKKAAKIGGMDRQTLRDWVIRFNDQGPDGLINKSSPGAPGKLSKEHKAFLTGRLSGHLAFHHPQTSKADQHMTMRGRPILNYATTETLIRNVSSCRSTAQVMRASLLASATTAAFLCILAVRPRSHGALSPPLVSDDPVHSALRPANR